MHSLDVVRTFGFSCMITSTKDSRTLESDDSILTASFTSPKASLKETKLLIPKAFKEPECLHLLFTNELSGGTTSFFAKSMICLLTTNARDFEYLPALFGFIKQLLAKLNNCSQAAKLFSLTNFEESLLKV